MAPEKKAERQRSSRNGSEPPVEPFGPTLSAADALLTASRALVGVAARSLAGRAEEITIPQFRALIILAERGPLRPVDLAGSLSVASSTVTRLCDRLVRKSLIARDRTEADRREVQLSLTPAGRRLIDEVTGARRDEIERILTRVPLARQRAIVEALEFFGAAAGEVPGDQWDGAFWEL